MLPVHAILVPSSFAAHITLTGTSPSPNVSANTPQATGTAGWRWNVDGTVDKNDNGVWSAWDTDPEEWTGNGQNPLDDLWIRFTLDAGEAADSITPAVGTWGKLSGSSETAASFTGTTTSSQTGTYQVDIATDSGGTNIIATGYYQYLASGSV